MAGPLNSTALFLLAISALFLSVYSAACYNPDGTNRNGQNSGSNPTYAYQACDNTVAVSMCCAIGPTVAYPDICVPGELCYNSATNLYWRESCTDQTWMSPACIKLFLNGTGVGLAGDTVVTPCDDGSYCYGESALACCKGGNGLFVVNGTETIQNPNQTTTAIITTTAPPSSSISQTSTTSPSSGLGYSKTTISLSATQSPSSEAGTIMSTSSLTSATSSPSPSSSSTDATLSTSAKAGIGIGAVVGAIVLLTFGYLIWRQRQLTMKLKQQIQVLATQKTEEYKDPKAELSGLSPDHLRWREQQRHELVGEGNNILELPADDAG